MKPPARALAYSSPSIVQDPPGPVPTETTISDDGFFRDHSKTRSGTAKSARENNIQASGRSIAFWCNVAGIGMKSQILNIGIQAQTSTPSLKSMPEDHRQRCQNSQN
jgi:hypothetical protein